MRRFLVLMVALPFVALSIYDFAHGRPRTGVIAALGATCNILIYWY